LAGPDRDAVLEPLGLTKLLRARAGRLSRGERRRVVLAEALLLGRPVVVLDEPFAAFDALQLRTVVAELRRRAGQGTAFVVSIHQLEQALRVADRVVLLQAGQVVAHGTEAQLRAQADCPDAALDDVVVRLLTGGDDDAT
jgi:ABC-type multidrug transport system ATPase subunit